MRQQWIVPPPGNMIEPAVAPTIYANGQSAVEWLANGDVVFHLTQQQLPLETLNGIPQAIVVAHVIKPLIELPALLVAVSQCLQWHLCRHGPVCPVCPDRPTAGGSPLRVVG